MSSLYHKFLKKIAHFQVEHPVLTVLLILTLTVAMLGGASQVKTVASLEQMMPKETEEIKAFNTLRDNGLGQDTIAIILELDRNSVDPNGISDIMDKRVYDYILYVRNLIQLEPDIIDVYSLVDIVENVVGEENINSLTEKEYEAIISDLQVKEYLKQFVNEDRSITMLIGVTDVSADDPRMNLLATKVKEDIDSSGRPPGISIAFTGTPIIQQKLGELISSDRASTQWISTLLVFLITMLIFRSFASAVVPIVIVTISVNWLYGTMGYNNLPISTLAGGVAAMVIGIGIDFAIHIMNKFKFERKKGLSIKRSIELAVVETGTALSATSVTTVSAFLAFLVGQMPEMGRFGILMAIGIFFSLVFTLFGLPALLIIEEKIIYWIKDKYRFGVERELKLEKVKPNVGGK